MEGAKKTLATDQEKGIEPVKFTLDQFGNNKKKVTPQRSEPLNIADVVGDETKVSNKFKALLELNDTEIKDKFIDIEVANEFINGLKKEKGEKPVDFKTFSKAFYKEFRDVISGNVL
jgi:hypothetical protein